MAKTMEKPEVLVEDELVMVDEVEQVEDDVEIKEDAGPWTRRSCIWAKLVFLLC